MQSFCPYGSLYLAYGRDVVSLSLLYLPSFQYSNAHAEIVIDCMQ